jgi:hypothetical protein
MNHAVESIRRSLVKRQEALQKYDDYRQAFLLAKKQITQDIEDARSIWISTREQLPKKEFD